MVTRDELDTRREEIARTPELRALLARLVDRAGPLLDRELHRPDRKALLSADGGVCPDDGAALRFDPWSPHDHRCPRCGRSVGGERHHRAWAKWQHLWLAERAAHLAAVGVLADRGDAVERARRLLADYGSHYREYPNRDNVLGPARLFFSTYLESLWLTNYLAAATMLREADRLDDGTAELVSGVADEAANLIGDFDEGFSNRQTWHSAALAAVAVWFEDEALASRAIEGPTGLLAHLAHGFGIDGMWYEGENYHLFALRGLLTGLGWARLAGVDPFADPELAGRLRAALLAPAASALPDFTFPARKDSRFGISLAQPMHLETWEVGLARLTRGGAADVTPLAAWLGALYRAPATPPLPFEAYLHDAGAPSAEPVRSPAGLGWWALLEAAPSAGAASEWRPGSVLLEDQGLAVLRSGARYASLECGRYGGGHGHPDRLHLTLHADGVHWLPDYGTGSYVSKELFWYRSTLAHNAPRLDGASQPEGDAVCEAFDVRGDWAWVRGRYGELTRTLVAGPDYLLDLVELAAAGDHQLELAWHLAGRVEVESPGRWEPAESPDPFAHDAERFVPDAPGPLALRARGSESVEGPGLRLLLQADAELLRARAPGAPGATGPAMFHLLRGRGRGLRWLAALTHAPAGEPLRIDRLTLSGEVVEVELSGRVHRHRVAGGQWEVTTPDATIALGGRRAAPKAWQPLVPLDRPTPAHAVAVWLQDTPRHDGSLDGFETREPLTLDVEDQYRRSEEPYPGPEELSARAYAGWNEEGLHLAVEVVKAEVVLRPPAAPPLRLDNEPDDIHSDGLQVYLAPDAAGRPLGFLVVPEADGRGLRVAVAGGCAGAPEMVRGAWAPTQRGYRVTLSIAPPDWPPAERSLRFDLIVNEMRPGRERRAGQLVWSGGGGWVWLRGDRQDPRRFGILELR